MDVNTNGVVTLDEWRQFDMTLWATNHFNTLDEEVAALASARRALAIANHRYKAGVEQYLEVIVAQTSELTHEQTVIQLRGQRLAASVALIKSLGAGWKPASTASLER